MARNVQLLSLIAQLRAETGRTQQVSVGINEVENLKALLRRVQEVLYDDYEWSHLSITRTVQLNAGQRYYDFPTDLNFDRITDVKVRYNGQYIDVERGIDFTDYSSYDSNADTPARSNQVMKWDIVNTGDDGADEQIEAWPIPADGSQVFYFKGTKALSNLIAESDRCDLDDKLIVLFAAAEMLARQKSSDYKLKLDAANARMMTLRRNAVQKRPTYRMGLGSNQTSRKNLKIVIAG